MKLIVGNQKSYMNSKSIDDFLDGISFTTNNVVVCPSSIYFNKFNDINVLLGSQTVSNYDSGAMTGELSCEQLKSINVHFSIVGHSERREKTHESIEDTNIKVKNLLDNKMIPILCVGETKEERDNNKTKEVIEKELVGAFKDITSNLLQNVIIAYEPIWAIGTGVIPSNLEIEEIVKYIKDFVKEQYNTSNIVLYGGSVNSKNIDELNKIYIVDGYLIGGASTKKQEFMEIIEKCK